MKKLLLFILLTGCTQAPVKYIDNCGKTTRDAKIDEVLTTLTPHLPKDYIKTHTVKLSCNF